MTTLLNGEELAYELYWYTDETTALAGMAAYALRTYDAAMPDIYRAFVASVRPYSGNAVLVSAETFDATLQQLVGA